MADELFRISRVDHVSEATGFGDFGCGLLVVSA